MVWFSIQRIRNLKWMDLGSSKNLKELPDLSNVTNLEKLNLCNCSSLEELPSSIGNAINLVELDLSFCTRLVELPSSIWNAINLVKLNLCGCTRLVELPSSIENVVNLQKLNISIGRGINPRSLNLKACSRLKEQLDLGNATNLKHLDLTGCLNMFQIRSSVRDAIDTSTKNLRKHGLRKIPIKEWKRPFLLPKILQLKDLSKG